MMRFKVGDEVIIHPDVKLETEYPYGNGSKLWPNTDMLSNKSILRVTECLKYYYKCSDGWYYADEWLLPVPIFKVGDIVTIKEGLKYIQKAHEGVSSKMTEYEGRTATILSIMHKAYTPDYKGQDGYSYRISIDDTRFSWESREFVLPSINILKTKQNEDQLQRQESVVSRGGRLTECGICYRRNKATISLGHLSNREISSR